ncbi:MAG: TIR domain-containing protein [Phaeodactylibacter sp.]|nr:TIR domain-containing protein [Phaeodactylibacter sp.]MCB9287950.1 TIR domain-containing protein [Lewinellaceae bacterium]
MRYHAFISYSHAADGQLAPALQRALQQLAKPLFKVRALNVFRDETSLSATPHLWGTIEKALGESGYLVLLASPVAATSPWVQKEVDFWLQNKSADTILIGLTEGEIIWNEAQNDFDWEKTNAIPPNLAGQFLMEPLYMDFRAAKTGEDLSVRNPDFKKKAAGLAAAIRGIAVNDLIGEDIRLQKKAVRLRNSAIAALLVLLSATLGLAWLSNENAKAEQAQRIVAEEQTALAEERKGVAEKQTKIAEDRLAALKKARDSVIDAQVLAKEQELLAEQRKKETEAEAERRIEQASLRQVAQAYRFQYADPFTAAASAFEAYQKRKSDETAEALNAVHEVLIERRRIAAEEKIMERSGGWSNTAQVSKGQRFTRLSRDGNRVLVITERGEEPYSQELRGEVYVLDNKTLELKQLQGCDRRTGNYRLEYAGFVGEDKIMVARAFYLDLYTSEGRCLEEESYMLIGTKTAASTAGGFLVHGRRRQDTFFIAGSASGCVWVGKVGGDKGIRRSEELSAVSHCDVTKEVNAVFDIQVDPSNTFGLLQFQSGRVDLFFLDGSRGIPKSRLVLEKGGQSMIFHPSKEQKSFVVATDTTAEQAPRLIRWNISRRVPVLVGEYKTGANAPAMDFIGISANGKWLVALDQECVLRIWDFESRKLLLSQAPGGLVCPDNISLLSVHYLPSLRSF